jgi:hypothetical protein
MAYGLYQQGGGGVGGTQFYTDAGEGATFGDQFDALMVRLGLYKSEPLKPGSAAFAVAKEGAAGIGNESVSNAVGAEIDMGNVYGFERHFGNSPSFTQNGHIYMSNRALWGPTGGFTAADVSTILAHEYFHLTDYRLMGGLGQNVHFASSETYAQTFAAYSMQETMGKSMTMSQLYYGVLDGTYGLD